MGVSNEFYINPDTYVVIEMNESNEPIGINIQSGSFSARFMAGDFDFVYDRLVTLRKQARATQFSNAVKEMNNGEQTGFL